MTLYSTTKRLAAVASIVIVSGGLAACDSDSSDASSADCEKTYRIGYSNPASQAAGVQTLIENLEQIATERGCIEMLFDNTTDNNLESQRATLESWVLQQVDAIVALPVDVAALDGIRQDAQAQGIKWIGYGVPLPDADGLAGFDSDLSGELVGQAAVEWLEENHPDGGVTAEVGTLTPLPDVSGRWDKPIAMLEEAGVEIVSEQDCATQDCGLQITESVLQAHPNLRVVIGFNDDMALGAAKAFENADIDLSTVFIVGQDGSLEALKAVQTGRIFGTAAIDNTSLANAILDASINAVEGEGETDLTAETTLAGQNDMAVVEDLIAAYKDAGFE